MATSTSNFVTQVTFICVPWFELRGYEGCEYGASGSVGMSVVVVMVGSVLLVRVPVLVRSVVSGYRFAA